MSKKLDRYWQIEYQLQYLWEIPHKARDYDRIGRLNAEKTKIIDSLREEEYNQLLCNK